METLREFKSRIRRACGKRGKSKITDSYGVYDAYRWVRKNKWLDIGTHLTEHQWYRMIQIMHNYFKDKLLHGESVQLPCRMGALELRKFEAAVHLTEDGRIRTTKPVNWDATLELWYNDPEAMANKTLIRFDVKEKYKFYYNKAKSKYTNQWCFQFRFNRDMTKAINDALQKGWLNDVALLGICNNRRIDYDKQL